MKNPLIISSCILAMAVSGCAQNSSKIEAAQVSTIGYDRLSCSQIRTEAQRVAERTGKITGEQNKAAQNDAVATGVALVVFWPAVFLIKGNKTQAAELSRLKGELTALEQVSNRKKCGIVFQKAPVKKAKAA